MAKVVFTPNVQRHVACPEAEAPGQTVRDVLENVFTTNPQARALFHGKVSLPPWTLAMLVDIYQLPQTAKPAMTVNLQGPVDRPNVGISGIAFQQNNQGTNPLQQLLQPKQPSASSGGSTGGSGSSGGTKVDPLSPLLQQLLGGQKTNP